MRKSIFYFLLLLSAHSSFSQNLLWHSVPERQIILNELNPSIISSHDVKIKVKSFELSQEQVSLASYKIFLKEIRRDSGEALYQSLLPDTNIGPKDVRDEYFNSGKFDAYPIVGISWDNALRYCKWLTVKNNPDSIQVVYRLPNLYEYYSAYTYLQSSATHNSLDNLYADWLMDSMDESAIDYQKEIPFSYIYFHLSSDPPVMKRKNVIGKSFQYSLSYLDDYLRLSYYADHGYRHIGFRIVKDTSPETFSIQNENGEFENPILKYWKLNPKK